MAIGFVRPNQSTRLDMKLGLITDIHEQVGLLRSALDQLKREQVDQIVMLGDVLELGERMQETCELLADAQVIGVWGNHDFGLCDGPSPAIRERYGDTVIDFMSSLQPRLEIDGCLFQHVEPWLNPNDILDLWYFEGVPDTPEKVARIFQAVPNRLSFAGHFHRWLMVTPDGMTDWAGDTTVHLEEPERYFVVIGALCYGRYAIFDTESFELVPRQIEVR